ncbi:hypothetical protein CKA32_000999 [Geitlerinema sp. FC II]|nr:hypothetical protein CKA32_000999 [Geitlerinema sp. FC II]
MQIDRVLKKSNHLPDFIYRLFLLLTQWGDRVRLTLERFVGNEVKSPHLLTSILRFRTV